MQLKRHRYRSVKNYWKASKIHSSGDMQTGHKKGKVRKTDEIIVEFCRQFIFRVEVPVNGVVALFAGAFCISRNYKW